MAEIWTDEPVVDNRPIVTEEASEEGTWFSGGGWFEGGFLGSGQGERWTEEALP
jgi:hypothetical protein